MMEPGRSDATHQGTDPKVERMLLRVAGALLVAGFLLEFVAEAFHPSSVHPNNHAAVFTEYAKSDSFTAIHVGQFIAIIVGLAGLLVLTAHSHFAHRRLC